MTNTASRKDIKEAVLRYFLHEKELTTKELMKYLSVDFPSWKLATIKTYLSKLKNEGVIHSIGRGRYSSETLPTYHPMLTPKMKSFSSKIKKGFPLLNYCLWDTAWFNEFQRHQMFNTRIIIEIEKDGVQSVFYNLREKNTDVFLMPDAVVYDRYVFDYVKPVIIEPLISESPLLSMEKTPLPTIEKLLVDIVANPVLCAAQQGELNFIYRTAFSKYAINISKMNRYASRRNQTKKVHDLINSAEW